MCKFNLQFLLLMPVVATLFVFTSISFPKNPLPHGFKLENISIRHLNWDQIAVSYEIVNPQDGSNVSPEQTMVSIFDAKGKIIAQSFGKRVLLNDASLSSEENIKVEIEVLVAGYKLKHVQNLKASKKFLNFHPMLVYPLKKQLFAGAYSIAPTLLRQNFNFENEFEVVEFDGANTQFFLVVNEEKSAKKIALPVKTGSGKFNLSESPQYNDFKPALESGMAEDGGASLKFSFVALVNNKHYESEATDVHLAFSGVKVKKYYEPKVQMDKSAVAPVQKENMISLGSFSELQKLAHNYARKLSETYRVIPESLQVNLNKWNYDSSTGIYEAEVAFKWVNTFVSEEQYIVRGTLTTDKQGRKIGFQRSYANQTVLDVERYSKTERTMALMR